MSKNSKNQIKGNSYWFNNIEQPVPPHGNVARMKAKRFEFEFIKPH